MRRGQAFGEADFLDTPLECGKAWLFFFKPEAVYLFGNDLLGFWIKSYRTSLCAAFSGAETGCTLRLSEPCSQPKQC